VRAGVPVRFQHENPTSAKWSPLVAAQTGKEPLIFHLIVCAHLLTKQIINAWCIQTNLQSNTDGVNFLIPDSRKDVRDSSAHQQQCRYQVSYSPSVSYRYRLPRYYDSCVHVYTNVLLPRETGRRKNSDTFPSTIVITLLTPRCVDEYRKRHCCCVVIESHIVRED
jgi:hypothetical protein